MTDIELIIEKFIVSETEYRVLTLWQPWASLWAHGVKKIETRPSPTSWTAEKGVYLIHAASKWTKEQEKICLQEPFKSELIKLGFLKTCLTGHTEYYNLKLPLGQIIGSVEVVSCHRIYNNSSHELKLNPKYYIDPLSANIYEHSAKYINEPELSYGDYKNGRIAWICQNPRLLKNPITYKGGQGYYQKFTGDKSNLIFI